MRKKTGSVALCDDCENVMYVFAVYTSVYTFTYLWPNNTTQNVKNQSRVYSISPFQATELYPNRVKMGCSHRRPSNNKNFSIKFIRIRRFVVSQAFRDAVGNVRGF